MIRFVNPGNAYYSLDDVIGWLCDAQVLTTRQSHLYSDRCCRYVSRELARAQCAPGVFDHVVPVILPFGDYFINWLLWANLLMLLPGPVTNIHKINEINMLLDDPDAVYTHPALFQNLTLIPVTKQLP